MPVTRRAALALGLASLAAPALVRAAQGLSITPVIRGLDEPWGLAFLPDGRVAVTERAGRLRVFADGGPFEVGGLPEVYAEGQGGLLDVMVPRDFAQSGRLWLSYSHPATGGASTGLGFGVLDGDRLRDFTRVHDGPPVPGGRHFGSRIVEGPDGTIFLTTGDRGNGALAQDIGRPEGKVLAFQPNGRPRTAPDFEGVEVLQPGLWSYGHRNIQGAALDADGQLWTVEHGARGGDELNRVVAGRNHGWPVITYGVNYDGRKIGEGTARDGMEQPVHYWDPSIAPSGLVIAKGAVFRDWRGHVLTGSLNSDLIARLDPAAGYAETRIETAETARVRDIREAPDGSLWFLSVGNGAAFRMTPA
ncbi:MAG: PQQ-dependent sugar dehydrogenase [Gemmobacter sp.]